MSKQDVTQCGLLCRKARASTIDGTMYVDHFGSARGGHVFGLVVPRKQDSPFSVAMNSCGDFEQERCVGTGIQHGGLPVQDVCDATGMVLCAVGFVLFCWSRPVIRAVPYHVPVDD